jgi:hypothetical protein
MNHLELKQTSLDSYSLGADYILVLGKLKFVNIDLAKYCKDKVFEICAIKIYMNTRKICVIAIYRSPSGNFDTFMSKLDTILKKLFKVTVNLIICGDININFLADGERKRQLAALLQTYNLISVVNFPTHIQQNAVTSIDNFSIDITKAGDYSIKPIINGLSDHDAQILTLYSFSSRPHALRRLC